MTGAPLLRLRGVSKRFGGIRALVDVDFSVAEGTVHGLIGANGSGKSTLIKTATGHVQPDAGEIFIAGEPVTLAEPADARRHGVGFVAQEIAVATDLSVAENITLAAEPRRGPFISGRASRRAARAALDRLASPIPVNAQVADLRPSEQRIVMIAAALHRDARLLIMDEPTAGMGLQEADEVLRIVEALAERSVTVLYVSHRLDEILRVCSVVSVMRDGRHVDTLERDRMSHGTLVASIVSEGQLATAANPVLARNGRRHDAAVPAGAAGGTLECRDLSGGFLRGLHFTAHAGEVVGLAGTLESGATQFLELVAGVSAPDAGAIVVDGEPRSFSAPIDALRAGVGYLAAGRVHAGIADQPVRENISLSNLRAVAQGGVLIRSAVERARVAQVSDRFGITPRLDDDLANLSGGNQQKALLSRLLFAEVQILALDDPMLGVDVAARRELFDAIRGVAAEGRIALVYSSDPPELIGTTDRICVFRDGRVVADLDAERATEQAITEAMAGFS